MANIKNLEQLLLQMQVLNNISSNAKKHYESQLAPKFSCFNYIYKGETNLSYIIGDLLNPNGSHGQKELFLRHILDCLGFKEPKIDLFDLQKAKIKLEVRTDKIDAKDRRIDILIKIPLIAVDRQLILCIENKPYAEDQKNQLTDYYEHLNNKYKDAYIHMVYLTPHKKEPSLISVARNNLETWKEKKEYSNLTYDEIYDALKNSLKDIQNHKVRSFIDDFCKFIEQKFKGINDMSDFQQELELIINNPENTEAAIKIGKYYDDIVRSLLAKLKESIEKLIEKDNLSLYPEFTFKTNKDRGINFYLNNHKENNRKEKLKIRVEFQGSNWSLPFIGIQRGQSIANSENTNIEEQLKQELQKDMDSKSYPWWIVWKYLDKDYDLYNNPSCCTKIIKNDEYAQYILEQVKAIAETINNNSEYKELFN